MKEEKPTKVNPGWVKDTKPEFKKLKSCKECDHNCCTNWDLIIRGTDIPYSLEKYPIGSKFNYDGIVLERNNTGRWDCIYLNPKTQKCSIYPYRPLLCRFFFCELRNKSMKFPKGVKEQEYQDNTETCIRKHF